ncbi:hypothetical protein HJZ14_09715 [Vibrio parahaemolyticus]|nr:hypothetical protein [Vibrio parahaemolyticus]MBE4505475.1 hypothetical protein [Vibrio parahaemolyticus]
MIDLKHVNGNVIIRLNTRHKFYKQVWAELKNIADKSEGEVSGADAVQTAKQALNGLTLMLVAFAKAQAMDEDPEKYEDLTQYWGQFMDTLLSKVKSTY